MSSPSNPIAVEIRRDSDCLDIPLPQYQTDGSAGMDLRAAVKEPLTIQPKSIALVPTGLYIALPPGYEAQVRPRSGLALKHGIGVMNSPGTIDSDYRGPINVILFNLGEQPFTISRGDRIAQMVIARVERIAWVEKTEINSTARGGGGFGHTGLQ